MRTGRSIASAPDRAPRRGAPWDAAAAVLLAAGTLALYAQVASHGFIHYDDDQYVLDNPHVRAGLGPRGVAWAFGTLHFSNWHPLTWLSHMLDVQLFGLDAGAHHLVSAGLHAANAALLFLVLARMTGARGRSALVAALFAVHPLHVESVAWIAERKDVLSTLFGLLALGAYARYAARPGPARYGAVALLFALSLAAKPMLVTLPFLLLLLDAWPLGRAPGFRGAGPPFAPAGWGRLALEKAPLLLLSLASSAVTVVAQSRWGALSSAEQVGLGARLANAAVAYLTYAWKTVWPARLAIFYPYEAHPAWLAGLAAALFLAVTAAVLLAARRAPYAAVGWCWFAGTLVPVIGIVQVGGQAMADRYTYVPAVGLFVLVAWGGDALASRWRAGPAASRALAVTAVALLAAVAWRQLGRWTDHEAVFRHAIAVTGPNPRAHGALASGLRREGRAAAALPEAEEAVRLEPSGARGWLTLGLVLHDLRRLDPARTAFERAAALEPALGSAWAGLGLVAAEQGRLGEAEAALRRATALEPEDVLSWNELGLVLGATGRLDEAVAAYRRALDADPGAMAAWSNLAIAYQRLGRTAEAGEAFAGAVRASPATPITWRNLGEFLLGAGRAAEAVPVLEEGLRRHPADASLLRALGLAQAGAGAREAALATARRLDPVDPSGAALVRSRAGATR